MRIIAFIQDKHSIKDIMKAQGIPDFQAPPPIPKFIDIVEAIIINAQSTIQHYYLVVISKHSLTSLFIGAVTPTCCPRLHDLSL